MREVSVAHYVQLHDWNVSPEEATVLQKEFRDRLRIQPLDRPIKTVAGADISFNKYSETVYAGIVVLQLPSLETIEEVTVVTTARFPYIPGFLSFREAPALLEAWGKLRIEPDVAVLDGQGIAHPRRMGIAAHLGLFLERPTVGCAKSVLTGRFDEPGQARGEWSPMTYRGETIGAALRTKNRVQPVYISPGHLIDLDDSIRLALACDGGYRIPEPTRRAHNLVNQVRREAA